MTTCDKCNGTGSLPDVWPWIITYRDHWDDPVCPPRKAWIEADSADEAKAEFVRTYANGNPRRKCVIYEVLR